MPVGPVHVTVFALVRVNSNTATSPAARPAGADAAFTFCAAGSLCAAPTNPREGSGGGNGPAGSTIVQAIALTAVAVPATRPPAVPVANGLATSTNRLS